MGFGLIKMMMIKYFLLMEIKGIPLSPDILFLISDKEKELEEVI